MQKQKRLVLSRVLLSHILLTAPTYLCAEVGENHLDQVLHYGGVAAAPPIIAAGTHKDLRSETLSAKDVIAFEQSLVELINQTRQTHEDLGGIELPPFKRWGCLTMQQGPFQPAWRRRASLATAIMATELCQPIALPTQSENFGNKGQKRRFRRTYDSGR